MSLSCKIKAILKELWLDSKRLLINFITIFLGKNDTSHLYSRPADDMFTVLARAIVFWMLMTIVLWYYFSYFIPAMAVSTIILVGIVFGWAIWTLIKEWFVEYADKACRKHCIAEREK